MHETCERCGGPIRQMHCGGTYHLYDGDAEACALIPWPQGTETKENSDALHSARPLLPA
jgi:hypothetical protein